MTNILNDKMLNGNNIQFSPTDELLLTAYSKGEVGHFKIEVEDYGRNFEFRFIKGMLWGDFIEIFDESNEIFELSSVTQPPEISLRVGNFNPISLNSIHITTADSIVDGAVYTTRYQPIE